MKEKAFENQVKSYLKSKGIWFTKIWGGGYQRAGIPDILACVNGTFFGIELKSETGKPSELQKYNVSKIQESGGVAGIYYPKDFERLKQQIEEFLK